MQGIIRFLIAFVAVVVVLTGCGEDDSGSGDGEQELGKYEQTWDKSYGDTSCREWRKVMTDHERFAGSADMIISAWRVDGVEGQLPEDQMVESFAANLSVACEANGQLVASEVGATLYVTAKDQFGPP